MTKPRRSWTAKNRMDMVRLILSQQLEVLDKFYPNYEKSRLMLKTTIESFNYVDRPLGGMA